MCSGRQTGLEARENINQNHDLPFHKYLISQQIQGILAVYDSVDLDDGNSKYFTD